MRKAILALVVVGMFIGASGVAIAGTQVWTTVDVPMGTTHFFQRHETQGSWYGDGDGGSWSGKYSEKGKTTAFTTEEFTNDQKCKYQSMFDTTNGEYDSKRLSELKAEGNTWYEYNYKARSLNYGKPEDITNYQLFLNGYTKTGDQPMKALPGTIVDGTAPGYGGDNGGSWANAIHVTNSFTTDEPVTWESFTWTNPQHYR